MVMFFSLLSLIMQFSKNNFKDTKSFTRVKLFNVSMVGLSGLEPPTSCLSGMRSNHLSYRPIYGGDKETRTLGPLRARQVLSQLSYTPIIW